MNEQSRKWIVGILAAVCLIICIALVIVGQRRIEAAGLMMQLVGLAGILVLIGLYNKKYK